jgi:hypothetical protein
VNQTSEVIEPKQAIVHSKKEYIPKFTNIACNGCQFKASSYCWGQCSFNIWKKNLIGKGAKNIDWMESKRRLTVRLSEEEKQMQYCFLH